MKQVFVASCLGLECGNAAPPVGVSPAACGPKLAGEGAVGAVPQARSRKLQPELPFTLRIVENPDETKWAVVLSLLIEAGKAEPEEAALRPAA